MKLLSNKTLALILLLLISCNQFVSSTQITSSRRYRDISDYATLDDLMNTPRWGVVDHVKFALGSYLWGIAAYTDLTKYTLFSDNSNRRLIGVGMVLFWVYALIASFAIGLIVTATMLIYYSFKIIGWILSSIWSFIKSIFSIFTKRKLRLSARKSLSKRKARNHRKRNPLNPQSSAQVANNIPLLNEAVVEDNEPRTQEDQEFNSKTSELLTQNKANQEKIAINNLLISKALRDSFLSFSTGRIFTVGETIQKDFPYNHFNRLNPENAKLVSEILNSKIKINVHTSKSVETLSSRSYYQPDYDTRKLEEINTEFKSDQKEAAREDYALKLSELIRRTGRVNFTTNDSHKYQNLLKNYNYVKLLNKGNNPYLKIDNLFETLDAYIHKSEYIEENLNKRRHAVYLAGDDFAFSKYFFNTLAGYNFHYLNSYFQSHKDKNTSKIIEILNTLKNEALYLEFLEFAFNNLEKILSINEMELLVLVESNKAQHDALNAKISTASIAIVLLLELHYNPISLSYNAYYLMSLYLNNMLINYSTLKQEAGKATYLESPQYKNLFSHYKGLNSQPNATNRILPKIFD